MLKLNFGALLGTHKEIPLLLAGQIIPSKFGLRRMGNGNLSQLKLNMMVQLLVLVLVLMVRLLLLLVRMKLSSCGLRKAKNLKFSAGTKTQCGV